MKERPILMTPENAQKVHAGVKVQTRRIVKPQPPEDVGTILGPEMYAPIKVDKFGEEYPGEDVFGVYSDDGEWGAVCPYGQVGDRLWIREKHWRVEIEGGGIGNGFLVYENEWVSGMPEPVEARPFPGDKFKAFPSIHMPRWACRTVVELTEIRVERLHDISPSDALAEGIFCPEIGYAQHGERAPVLLYGCLWESINGKDSWAQNPYVWVLSFRKVEP